MTSILSANCSHEVLAEISTTDITVRLEKSGVDRTDDPMVKVRYEKDVLYLLQSRSSTQQAWTKFLIGKNSDFIPQHNLTYCPPDIPLLVYTKQVPSCSRAIACYFDPGIFRKYTGLDGHWTLNRLMACNTINGPLMTDAMLLLQREVIAPGFASDLLIDSSGRMLLTSIGRHFNQKHDSPTGVPGNRKVHLSRWHLDMIRQLIEDTQGRSVTVEELARACNLSKDYLRHAFRKTTGRSISSYVEETKLNKAKVLLANSDLLLKQIAFLVGFANDKSFCVAFKRATGETPTGYRLKASPSSAMHERV